MAAVSVIVPVYNVEAFLDRCVRSVLAQTFPDFELILVDDGSTDTSGALCDALAREDARIRVIHQANGGLSAARNRGIEAAGGTYLIFLDSDDYWDLGVLEALYRAAKQEDADLVLFPLHYETETGEAQPAPAFPETGCYTGQNMLEMLCRLGTAQLVTAVNRLARASLWEDLRFPEGRFHEDEFTVHALYGRCRSAVLLDQPFYHYMQRQGSITKQENPGRRLDLVDAFLARAAYLKDGGRADLISSTLHEAMHYYLTLLLDYPLAELKKTSRWQSVSGKMKQWAGEGGSGWSRKEKLAAYCPQLWKGLHMLRRM